MSTQTDRFAETILLISSPIILEHIREHAEEFGIVSIVKVEITKDRSHADIYVSALGDEKVNKNLPKTLAPLANVLRREIGVRVQTYKIPRIRFKQIKNQSNIDTVQNIIHELSEQYGLNKET